MAEKSGTKSNAKFYCENCGTEVGEAESCPKCGSSFEAVRCPKCGLTGSAATFADGCPKCGYAPESEKSAPEKPVSKKSAAAKKPKNRTYTSGLSQKSALPLWVYIVSIAIFVFAAVAAVLVNF